MIGCIGLWNDDWGLEILLKASMDLTTFDKLGKILNCGVANICSIKTFMACYLITALDNWTDLSLNIIG